MRSVPVAAGFMLLAGFHQPATFEANAGDGGGNRIYFDGSPRHKSYDCTACHTDAPHAIVARVDFTPSVAAAYQPGTTYTVVVALVGEHLGFGTANNQNGFVAELVDDAAAPAGTLAPIDQDAAEMIDDGNVISGEGKDTTMWSFQWTAPPAGLGATTLYLGLVDGNGAASASVPENDPGGDDVAVVTMRLCEGSPGCADRPAPVVTGSKAAGCSAGGSASPWLVLAVLGLFRRRSVRVTAALAVMVVATAGCDPAMTPQDCPDHVCGGADGDAASNCAESWTCSPWEAPAGSDIATRACVDANSTGTTACKPATTATLPALDLEAYKCEVHPIFQRGCGQLACHGAETGHGFRIYTRGRLRNNQMVFPVNTCAEDPNTKVNLAVRGTGTVMCEGWSAHTPEEWNKNFNSARSFMLDVGDPDDSLLLREAVKGGLPHAQVKLFAKGDPDYTAIRNWLAGGSLGTTCNTGRN